MAFLVATLSIPIPLHSGCLFWMRNTLNNISNKANIKRVYDALYRYLADPETPLKLTTHDIEQLTHYSDGHEQDVFHIPNSDYVIKLTKWRDSKDPNFPKTFKDFIETKIRLMKMQEIVENKFPQFFAPALRGVTENGIPFTIQKKVDIPYTQLGKRKALNALIALMKKEIPNFDYDEFNNFAYFKIKNITYKIIDLIPSNVGYYNGNPVMIDCHASFTEWQN